MDHITLLSNQLANSAYKSGCWITLNNRLIVPHSQNALASMTSSMSCGIEQSDYSGMDPLQEQQNIAKQSFIQNSTSTALLSSLSAVNDQSVPSSGCGDNPFLNLLDCHLDSARTTHSDLCNTSTIQPQPQPPSNYPQLQTYEPSKRHQSVCNSSSNSSSFSSIAPSSNRNGPPCQIWPCPYQNTFQTISTLNTGAPDFHSPVADNTVAKPSQCLKTTGSYPTFGPNEFKLSISLSPQDVSNMQNVQWLYIDKTGVELALNINTSFLLEHLYNTYSVLNSTVKLRLPETGREYLIRPKDMEMIDVSNGEKIALFRKIWISDVPQQISSSEFPLYWSPQENDIEIVTLDKGRDEYRSIRDTFLLSMPESCVIGIERIQNKKLFIRYAFQKALLLDKNSGNEQNLNEQLLFHGTSKTPPSKIWQSEDGFDLRYCRWGMWGIGSYFAKKASYSDKYAYTYKRNYVQFREMLVANVLTGNSKLLPSNTESRQLTRPPVYTKATSGCPEVLYDSVTGFTGGSQIYVLYKLDMAYPSYLVRYFIL
mgnify:FL=1